MRKSSFVDIICFLFILLFVYASTIKLIDYEKFVVQIGQSPLLTPFAGLIAWLVPTIEITVAILLSFPFWRLIGLYCAFSLMTIFSAYIVAITQFSEYVPCSCGGVLEKMSWADHLIFNIGFMVLGLIGILIYEKQEIVKKTLAA